MKKRTVAFHTLGCKVNTYETDAMEQLLLQHGYEIVSFEEIADVYVINTCSVTNMADRKSRQMLHRAKKKNPESVVVAAGCYVQAATEELKNDLGVDLIIGNNRKKELPNLLDQYFKEHIYGDVPEISKERCYEDLELSSVSDHTRAYVKVQDGCNQFCSYCIIPYVRGRVRSRCVDDVQEEIERLVANGTKEVVLTGIHLSSYGLDLEEQTTLLHLIQCIHEIKGVERIRLGSLEPRIVTEDFAKELVKLTKICPHFHLSLQSGCDTTLKRMNRRYTAEEYLECCRILRKYFSNCAITTDVIAGFPGETEEEFNETCDFITKVQFYEMHIFKYSRRKGTKADKMPDQILEQEKTRRSNVLQQLEQEMSKAFREFWIGKEVTVLLEEQIEINGVLYMTGHTPEYVKAVIEIDAKPNTLVRGVGEYLLNNDLLLLKTVEA